MSETHSLEAHSIFKAVRAGFVGVRQVAVLAAVVDRPGLSVRDHSIRFDLNKPSVSRACSSLIAEGMVERSYDAKDKRLCVLVPTKKGIAAFAEVFGHEYIHVAA